RIERVWGHCVAAEMMVGEIEVKERPRPSPDYLMQLLNEKKLMTSLPNLCGIFTHLERLLDEVDPVVCRALSLGRRYPPLAAALDNKSEIVKRVSRD
ncbi:protein quaking-A isoform X4, partial [Clarias magur]